MPLDYYPNPTAKQFHLDQAHQIHFITGPWGSGKSDAAVFEVPWFQQRHPEQDVLVVRETYTSLQDSVITRWLKHFNDYGTLTGGGNGPKDWKWNKRAGKIDGIVKFRSAEDPSDVQKFLSVDVGMSWMEEVTPGMETTGLRNQGLRSELFAGIWARTRACKEERRLIMTGSPPPNQKHWIYRLFWEHQPLADLDKIMQTLQDMNVEVNFDWDAMLQSMQLWKFTREENSHNLPPGYTESFLPMLQTQDQVKRFYLGEPGSSYGGSPVYPTYSDDLHLDATIRPGANGQWWRGWDGGFNNPACVWAQVQQTGGVYFLAELQGHDVSLNDFIPAAYAVEASIFGEKLRAVRDAPDPSMLKHDDNVGTTGAQIFRDHGITPMPTTNDLWTRVQATQKLLGLNSMVKVHPRCEILTDALRGAYKRKMIGGVAQDTPDKNEEETATVSHVMNCAEYICTHLTGKPIRKVGPQQLPRAIVDKLGNWPGRQLPAQTPRRRARSRRHGITTS